MREATFRVDKRVSWFGVGLGIAPTWAWQASSAEAAFNGGHGYYASGAYYVKGGWRHERPFTNGYDEGDAITVRLDLSAKTVAFFKNGEAGEQTGFHLM